MKTLHLKLFCKSHINLIMFVFIILVIFSCKNSNDKINKTIIEQPDTTKTQASDSLNSLALKYGAILGFDTLNFSYTYQYQQFLKEHNRIIIRPFLIEDIVRRDSNYIITVQGIATNIYFRLTSKPFILEKILNDPLINLKNTRFWNTNYYLTIEIYSINKLDFKPTQLDNTDEHEESIKTIELDISDTFLCSGKILSIDKF